MNLTVFRLLQCVFSAGLSSLMRLMLLLFNISSSVLTLQKCLRTRSRLLHVSRTWSLSINVWFQVCSCEP